MQHPPEKRRIQPLRGLVVVGLMACASILGAAAFHWHRSEAAFLEQQTRVLQTTAQLTAEEANRTVGDLMREISDISDTLAVASEMNLADYLERRVTLSRNIRSIDLVDRDGRIQASSRARSIGLVTLSPNPERQQPMRRGWFGPPQSGRFPGETLSDLESLRRNAEAPSRGLSDTFFTIEYPIESIGWPGARIVIAIGVDRLLQMFAFLYEPANVQLGVYLYNGVALGASVADSLPEGINPVFTQYLPNREHGSFEYLSRTGQPAFGAFASPTDFPLVTFAYRDSSALSAHHYVIAREVVLSEGIALLITGLSTLALFILYRSEHFRSQALADARNEYWGLVASSPGLVFKWRETLDGLSRRFTFVGPQAEKILGLKPEDLLMDRHVFKVHPDDLSPLVTAIHASRDTGGMLDCKARVSIREAHNIRHFRIMGTPHILQTSGEYEISGIVFDVTAEELANIGAAISNRLAEIASARRPVTDLLRIACRLLEEAIVDCSCSFLTLDKDRVLHAAAFTPLAAPDAIALEGAPLDDVVRGLATAMAHGVPFQTGRRPERFDVTSIRANDVAAEGASANLGIESEWWCPVLLDDSHPFGLLNFAFRRSSVMHAETRGLVETVARVLGLTIAGMQAAATLENRERFLTMLTNNLQEGILMVSSSGLIEYASQPIAEYLDVRGERLEGKKLQDLNLDVITDDMQDVNLSRFEEIVGKVLFIGKVNPVVVGLRNGENIRWLEITPNFIGSSGGEASTRILATILDITERKAAGDRLRIMGQVVERTSQGVLVTDAENRVIMVNSAFTAITGYSESEMRGHTPSKLSSGRQDKAYYEAMWHAIRSEGHWAGEIVNRKKDGTVYPEWLTITEIRDAAGRAQYRLAVFTDISESKAAQAQIANLAFFDQLTQLPNRILLQDRIRQVLLARSRQPVNAAILFVDLDRFKHVNDSLGHEVGDLLLAEVAQRWRALLRNSDTLSRIGGDEFVVLLNPIASRIDAAVVAQKLLNALHEPIHIRGHEIHMACSIGISLVPEAGSDVDGIMREADTAMYSAKLRGRGRYAFFSEELSRKANERAFIEQALHSGLRRGWFELHYQPKINLETGRVNGAEALVRMRHPERGLISPADFIPIAEDSGLIVELGKWCLNEACAAARRLAERNINPGPIAVNVSAMQFQRGSFSAEVLEILERNGVPGSAIEIEVTESLIADDVEKVVSELKSLNEAGVQIAIDDFGSGYSSLSYLKSLPVNRLKIDRSFITNLPSNEDDEKIVSAIVELSRALGLEVVAEGVETQEQAQILVSRGCQDGQGYLFSRPVPEATLADWLSANLAQ